MKQEGVTQNESPQILIADDDTVMCLIAREGIQGGRVSGRDRRERI